MRRGLIILSFCLCANAYAVSTCTDIISQMNLKYRAPTSDQKAPWRELPWLMNVFGDAQTRTIKEDQYHWGNYTLVVRNGQVYDEAGIKPEKLKQYQFAPQLEQALAALGQAKSKTSRTLSEYRWACTDTSSTLAIIADVDNKIVSSSFFYCKSLREAGCDYGHIV